MNTDNQNNISEEIDLGIFIKSISKGISKTVINLFIYIKKKSIVLISIIFCGILLGYVLDNNNKTYISEIVVNTNYATNDYLFSKVNQINTLFSKSKSSKSNKFLKIETEPIVDVYAFINNQAVANNAQNSQNFEMIKLMAESGDINKIIKDEVTSKNYFYQKINIFSKEKINKKDINTILGYLNDDTYFDSIKKLHIQNTKERILKNDSTIKQINQLIESYITSIAKGNANVMFKNENSEVNSLISQKNDLIRKVEYDKESLITQNKIIRDNTIVYNQVNNRGIANKLKFILPILFILLFLFGNYVVYLNKKSKNII